MSEFSIKTDKVKVTAQEFVDISRELDIIKSQCEDVMNSLALPDGAGAPVRASLAKCISELEGGKVNTIIYGDSLYDIATIYEETEKRVIEYPEQKVKKPEWEEKESQSDVPEAEQVYDADAIIDTFMDTWAGDVLALIQMSTSSTSVISKTVADLSKGMTLMESLVDTEEYTKGTLQALPKYAIDMVEGATLLVDVMLDMPSIIENLPTNAMNVGLSLGIGATQLWQRIETNGFDNTVKEIAGDAWQGVVTKYEDTFVNVSPRERGENEMRAAITIVETITAVKALKSLAMSGKAASKLDDAAKLLDDGVGDTSDTVPDILNTKPSINQGKDPFRNADFKKQDIKMVNDAANQVGIDRKEFGNYIHEIKADLGMKANQNFTYQELLELAKEYKNMTE